MPELRPHLRKVEDYPATLHDAWKLHLAERAADAPTVISTFAGAGGSSLGYSIAGYRELLAVEWDDNAVETFKLNFPHVPVYHGDIAKLTTADVLAHTGLQPGELDVFDGSPPCQGFSTAGRRMIDDPRNYLFREYVRLLDGLQPKVFIMENVAGMVKGKMKLVFAEILRELKARGYKVSARLLNAAYFGVPQSRQRMIFVGVRQDLGIEPSHPQAQTQPLTAREAWEGLPLKVMLPDLDHVWVNEVAKKTKWIGRAARLRPGEKLVEGVASSMRCHWNRPLPTIQKGGLDNTPPYVRSSPIHPSEPRTLSIREMARAQSFPDEFRFVEALHNGQQRIGNSVPPLFMRAIALHVREHILEPSGQAQSAIAEYIRREVLEKAAKAEAQP